ncbi:hypothetical protein ABES38_11630 [Bacillus gobiensis]|uniref:hypothetical protein n=1 Tax=Bacillus gobiensis TaxID=1441095 RepID=UPI003D1B3F55
MYIALENADFVWRDEQVKEVDKLWKDGAPLDTIAKLMGRTTRDVFILIYDRLDTGKLSRRRGSIFGQQHSQKAKGE